MDSSEPIEKINSANPKDEDKEDDSSIPMNFLMSSPAFMSATVRRQLLHEYMKALPKNMQNRLNALRNIQLEALNLEAKFFEEVFQLECKYQQLYQPLQDKRRKIVTGEYEPTEKEITWTEQEDESMDDSLKDVPPNILETIKNKYADDVKGIPEFWLTVFRNTEMLTQMAQKHDEPALQKLTDIKIVYGADNMSFTLEFYFAKNEFFTNEMLTKQYFLKSKVDTEYPFTFEGPEIFNCKGCVINWNKGMNLTVKTIHKKQKHKARGAVRTVSKQVPNDSFFNFFNPPEVPEDQDAIDLDTQSLLSNDFEIGHFLRSRIIPKAALYYTGDIVDDDEDEFDEEEEEEEEDDEDESDDSDGGQNNKTESKKMKKPIYQGSGPPECQQQ